MNKLRARKAGAATATACALLVLTGCPQTDDSPEPVDNEVRVVVQLDFNDKSEDRTRPIVGVQVEVWTYGPVGPHWGWAKDAAGVTDGEGRFETVLPFRDSEVEYAIRVIPNNGAMQCCAGWLPTGFALNKWWIEPGEEAGMAIHHKVGSAAQDVEFTHLFSGEWGSIFNTLDVVRHSAQFVRDNHRNRDGDRLEVARLGLAGSGPKDLSWFDPLSHKMNLTPRDRWVDLTVLHEYAHYVQAQIGTLAWIASSHSGCTPGKFAVFGGGGLRIVTQWADGSSVPAKERAQHAWLEGFADWLAEVVYWHYPGAFLPKTDKPLESASCREAGPWPDGDRFEHHVAAFLWDLTDPYNSDEPKDLDSGLARANEILTLVDNEVDSNAYWPTIADLTSYFVTHFDAFPTDSGGAIAGLNKVSWIYIN